MKHHLLSVSLVLGLLAWAFAPHAFSASFDCTKATSPAEVLLCKDSDTSSLDDKLQKAYKAALSEVAPSSKKALIEEQRHWMKYTRDACQDEVCLQQAYTARIAVLARNEKYIIDDSSCEPSGDACLNVVTYRDPSVRISSFNRSLVEQKQHGKIISCSRLINLPVGTANGNNSYGGLCTLQNNMQRKAVKICNDDMFGHFQMQPATPRDVSGNGLIDFTHNYCFGG